MSMIGETLGSFQIHTLLGKGGMGEVYQAKDQKLGRDVAIKILPEEFARDTDRVARFHREAKLLASLNHPNIAAIHGLEEAEGTHFLVLELVEGDTIADRLKRGSIPVEEALKLALQIAEALEAAHEKGVIHRDLKPANIKVTPDNKVKVLDFGLAKAFAGDQSDLNLSNSPTLSEAATMQGVILGTAAYMPPEQAKGKSVDKRADIWAFGVVLFEMLSGRALFTGETVSETLASVIKSEPEWKSLPPNLHPRIRLLLERCLEKEPKDRYSGAGDARVDIQKVLEDPSGVFAQDVTAAKSRTQWRVRVGWVAAIAILCIIAGGMAIWYLKPNEPRRIMRFDYDLPEGQQFSNLNKSHLSISPDGSQFVYSTNRGLYIRSLDQQISRLIPGTDENSQQPLFSPDGKWICYFCRADGQLKKIALSGGAPITLCRADEPRHPSWDIDDSIVYAQAKGIMRISPNGGMPELLVAAEGGDIGEPQILPDGKTAMFAVGSGENKKIYVQSLKTGERKELFSGDNPRYLPTGHIVYGLGNNLFAIPFDLGRLEVTGGPASMVEDVLHTGLSAHSQYAISDTGTLIYTPETVMTAIQRTLVWVQKNGKEESIPAPSNNYAGTSISPDGKRLALTITDSLGNVDIWIWDTVRETIARLTFNDAEDSYPVWTPDGKRITFHSHRQDGIGAYWKAADGTGEVEFLASLPGDEIFPWCWSSDGKSLALWEMADNIGIMSADGDRPYRTLLKEEYAEMQPKISHDGRWMAYTSDQTGQNEIYVRPFPEVNEGKWQVSTGGGDSPLWSPDGRELFYRSGDSVMVVSVNAEPNFSLGTSKILFRGKYVSLIDEFQNTWDINPDGKRFLMLKSPGSIGDGSIVEGSPQINIVVNWFEELEERFQ